MVVSFPFTFSFSIPGLTNPFSAHLSRPQSQLPQVRPGNTAIAQDRRPSPSMAISHRRSQYSPSPSFVSITRPNNLKRGWEPAFAEPIQSATTLASTSGYLDTPSKYREMASAVSARNQSEELPPPSKKRRGLAGSIVSTAVSAALIGTAVGLTVYRLWRDRGKDQSKTITATISANGGFGPVSVQQQQQQLPPPPPYQEREWTTISHPSPTPEQEVVAPVLLPSPAPRRKVHRHGTKRPRRMTTTARVHRTQTSAMSPPRVGGGSGSVAGSNTAYVPQPEFDFGRSGAEEGEVVDDQMDWIGDKLAKLIEEGKRALGREVVVMSDAREDEVDDGSGAWEEEENADDLEHDGRSVSRSNSTKRAAKRSRNHGYGSPSPSRHHLPVPQSAVAVTPRKTHTRGFSAESITRDLVRDDESQWQSPELRESMQKARERMLANRGTS